MATLPASSRSQTHRAVECRLPAVIVWIAALDLSALRAVMSLREGKMVHEGVSPRTTRGRRARGEGSGREGALLVRREGRDEVVRGGDRRAQVGGQGVERRVLGQQRGDGGAPGDVPRAEQERVASGVDLKLVALAGGRSGGGKRSSEGRRGRSRTAEADAPEDVRDVVLGLGGLALGPGVVGRLLAGKLARAGVAEAPDDGRAAVLDVRARRPLGKLAGRGAVDGSAMSLRSPDEKRSEGDRRT